VLNRLVKMYPEGEWNEREAKRVMDQFKKRTKDWLTRAWDRLRGQRGDGGRRPDGGEGPSSKE
jgi:hypothetical protein